MVGLSAALSGAFVAVVSQAWARGLTVDRGCVGGAGPVTADHSAYTHDLARDSGFLLLAVWLLIRPASYLTLDQALTAHRPTTARIDPKAKG